MAVVVLSAFSILDSFIFFFDGPADDGVIVLVVTIQEGVMVAEGAVGIVT